MSNDKIVFLNQLYNTFCLIHTKGEDSLIMADCLRAFQNFLTTLQQEQQELINKKEE